MNLRLLQLADSALPIGGYTHSWGLEAAIQRGLVHDASTLEAWTRSWLHLVLGPCEGVVMACAFREAQSGNSARFRDANAILTTSLNPSSVRAASREMGEQLLSLARGWSWSAVGVRGLVSDSAHDEVNWHHAVVFGILAALAGSTCADALAAYLHQASLGMIAAALRTLPIGHTHGQQVLAYLHDDIAALVAELAGRDLEQAGSGSPFYEVLCDEQTRLYTRLFRS